MMTRFAVPVLMWGQNIPWGLFVIRVGLAGVLLWFGAQQFIDPLYWSGYVPAWAMTLLPLSITGIVYMNAALEITGGVLILFGLFTRLAALAMGLHLTLIAISLGHTEIAVRDWGLAFAFFGIALAHTPIRTPRSVASLSLSTNTEKK